MANENIYSMSKSVATHLGIKCNGKNCASCDRDCMCIEFASIAYALGYRQVESQIINKTIESVQLLKITEELAKKLAYNRGHGCNASDCCLRCICYGNCIPYDIAKHLIQNGYRKEE